MTWTVRHEGSPQSIEGLSHDQVLEGLRDGVWEPTDEVMGPGETTWLALENHPQFAEAAAEIEPPPPKVHEDETNLDMNPLIDVALVLLVFFMLTATYEMVRKVIEAPSNTPEKTLKVIGKGDLPRLIIVKAFKEDGKTIIQVDGEVVEEANLERTIARKIDDKRKEVLMDVRDIDWGTLVAIQNAAKSAGAVRGLFARPPKASTQPQK